MNNLRIGHFTNLDNATGASVFLFEHPAIATYWLCGSSPATRELTALDLDARVSHIDGLVLLGGSAFGLGAADGAMQWFREQNRGWPTPYCPVPIVPAAAIYDLGTQNPLPPTVEEVYQACVTAYADNLQFGRIGAGTGATIGKLVPHAHRMTGGIGRAFLQLPNEVAVLAYAVVNAVGDVRDENGYIVAGAQLEDGRFADAEHYLLSHPLEFPPHQDNTTLVILFTNAAFSKIELKRIAKMASAGIARAITPIFTPYDGDIIFSVSLGCLSASEIQVGTMAAEVIRQAIVSAVLDSVVVDLS